MLQKNLFFLLVVATIFQACGGGGGTASNTNQIKQEHTIYLDKRYKSISLDKSSYFDININSASNIKEFFIIASNPNPQKTMLYSNKNESFKKDSRVVDARGVEIDENKQVVLAKEFKGITTNYGKRDLKIYVEKEYYSSSCIKEICIDSMQLEQMARQFLQEGEGNDIYDYVTNIYGVEFDNDLKESRLISYNKTISLYLVDLPDSLNGSILYKNLYKRSFVSDSKEGVIFYLNANYLIKGENKEYWEKKLYSTLAHEFTHLIYFYNSFKYRKQAPQRSETWLNELLAISSEDILSSKLHSLGPRGVLGDEYSAGNPFNFRSLYGWINQEHKRNLVSWSGDLVDYAKVGSLGAFLLRKKASLKLFEDIMKSSTKDPLERLLRASGYANIALLLQDFALAYVRSDKQEVNSFNTPQATVLEKNGIVYTLGAINFFNYFPQPRFYKSETTLEGYSNTIYVYETKGSYNIKLHFKDEVILAVVAK